MPKKQIGSVTFFVDEEEEINPTGLSNAVILKSLLIIMLPMLIPAFMLNILYYSFRTSIEMSVALTAVIGSVCIMGAYSYYNKVASELHGRKNLIVTFREKGAETWQDWGSIVSQKPFSEYVSPGNPAPRTVIPYEIVLEDFPYKKMIVLSPCPFDKLVEFTPQPIVYKGLILNASAGFLDVTKVRTITKEGEIIPIVVPTGADYITENIQKSAKSFDVSKEELDNVVAKYDTFKSIELKQMLVSKEAELASALEALKDFDRAVEERANAKVRAYLKTRKTKRFVVPSILHRISTWIVLGLLVFLGIIVYLVVT